MYALVCAKCQEAKAEGDIRMPANEWICDACWAGLRRKP